MNFNVAYETIAAGQTDQVLGPNGHKGNILSRLIVIPATTSPGVVQIQDGDATAITVFAGGGTSVADLKPFVIDIDAISVVAGGWSVTTGANVSVIAVGKFS